MARNPYRYGGQDRDGTDCSGLVMEVYRKVCLVKIPRTTKTQKSYCLEVARNKARAGDLFSSALRRGEVPTYLMWASTLAGAR